MALLRERNAELRRRLDGLVARAEQNEALLHATQEVISSLAERSSKDDIASLFCALVKKSFSVELVAFHWCGDNGDSPSNAVASHLLGNKNATSGPLRAHELKALFDEEATEGSAALARLTTRRQESAVIAVGSVDATRYGIGEGTLFLEYLADVISSLPIKPTRGLTPCPIKHWIRQSANSCNTLMLSEGTHRTRLQTTKEISKS